MKNKSKNILISGLALGLLTGCVGSTSEDSESAQVNEVSESEASVENNAYEIAIEKGLEELENEEYEKAEAYFEIALEEKEEDEKASGLLEQTRNYVEAWESYKQEDYEKARVKAEVVQSIETGSDTLITRTNELLKELDDVAVREQAAREEEKAEEESFETFKGMYVEFGGVPYESLYDRFLMITDEKYIEGVNNAGVPDTQITGKSFNGDTLVLDLYIAGEEGSGFGESSFQLDFNVFYDENGYKYILMEDGALMYPVSVDEMVEKGFGLDQHLVEELRPYDAHVPRSVDLLAGYSEQEIEYARVWLNVMNNPNVEELRIYYDSAGDPINRYHDENSAVYPEDVTTVTGMYGADGHVVYSGNGDGTINIYDVPTHWHARPEQLPAIYEEILDTHQVYLEPMDGRQVANLIERMTIVGEREEY